MDEPHDAGTPEWRPASSASGGVPSTSIASITLAAHLHPQRGVSMTSSDYGSTGVSSEIEAAAYRDLAPWEASICERLTEQIRASADMKHSDVLPPNESSPRSIEWSLKEAAAIVQYNAKWFAEDQLEILIGTAIDAVMLSNSSTELFAAVKLIDTVATYSYIPQASLSHIVRFLAQTYYGATRAVKTKRLALATWQTLQRLLLSHLGEQCTTTLFAILETSDQTFLSTQSGYSQAAGAILLMMDIFVLNASALSGANIFNRVTALHVVSKNSPPNLCELVLDAMCQVVEDDQARKILDDILGWDLVLETADMCIRNCPKSVEAQKMLEKIMQYLNHFETRELQTIALLVATFLDAMTPALANELPKVASLFEDTDNDMVPQKLVAILKILSRSKTTLAQFEMFTRTGLPVVLELSRANVIEALAQFFLETANNPNTSIEISESLSYCATKLLEHFSEEGGLHLQTIFELCCRLAIVSPIVANKVLRLRADVENGLYLKGSPLNRTFAYVNDFAPLATWDRTVVTAVGMIENWETYDCFTSQLPDILSNHSLFQRRVEVIKELRAVICEQLRSGNYPDPPESTKLAKSYVAKNLIQSLVAIISYHEHLTKQELISTVSMFLEISGMRDYVVSINCIHALTVCCYELPVTMSSYMDDVIDKMAKMVTQNILAIHVLQFLAGLSRLPALFRNFKGHDFKKIFGVCGSYLQSIRGSEILERGRLSDPDDNNTPQVDTPDALPQYVYALAHHVICFWYIAIKPADRKPLKNYITSCLRYQTSSGREKIEDQGLVTIDLMDAIDANDEDDSVPFDFYDTEGRISTLHRITGTMLITTQTSLRSAKSMVEIRRASGRWKRFVASTPGQVPVCPTITLESDSDSFTFIVPEPENMFTYGRIYVPAPTSVIGSADILPLRLTPEIDRAIQSLDRVPGLDSHKTGVIYVGEGQTSEFEILQNSSGSPDFWEFVHLLGEPRRLKAATWNTEGLDRENDLDGTSAIVWENPVTQLVFHVTSLMPKQEDSIINKKKHIGNDAVNIVFNNSGHPFLFDTLPTQVTNAYIVISPSDRTSFLQARRSVAPDSYESSNLHDRFYNVHMLARPGYPTISPANSEKVVSGRSLPAFVRNLVLNECVFGLMWAYRHDAPGEFPSSWRARLRQLRVISERHAYRGMPME